MDTFIVTTILQPCMESLDDDIRLDIETQIDYIYKEPKKWESIIRGFLMGQGIEPNLETILSMIAGMCWGMAYELIQEKFDRSWTPEEAKAIRSLLARRSHELRHRFLSIRLEE